MSFLPGWFPAGAARVLPKFNLADSGVVSGDASFYSRTFDTPNEHPDRYIVVLSSTGKNSGTSNIDSQSLGGTSPTSVDQAVGKAIGTIAYKHYPVGLDIDYQINLDSTQSAWVYACYEVWGLTPGLVTASRQGVGNIIVPENGLLFVAAAGDNTFTLTGLTELAENDGSDISRRVASKLDFYSQTTFNITATDTTAPFALAALALR